MNYINLTPHEIHVYDESGKYIVSFPPSGNVLRVGVESEKLFDADGIPFFNSHFTGLNMAEVPEGDAETFYIVSKIAKEAILAAEREDAHKFVTPGQLLRDEFGNVVGCIGFQFSFQPLGWVERLSDTEFCFGSRKSIVASTPRMG